MKKHDLLVRGLVFVKPSRRGGYASAKQDWTIPARTAET